MKLQTPIQIGPLRVDLRYQDRILALGSCFADSLGQKLAEAGFQISVNPFGTLYNPVSVCNSVARLDSGAAFTAAECVKMGANAGLVCSFSHHSAFARPTEAEFLEHANAELRKAADLWKDCNKVLVTLGTAWCFRFEENGLTVSNCLKRPSREFTRYRLEASHAAVLLERMVAKHPDKQFLFTVSPIRHLADGAHGNQLSKSILLLAEERVCEQFPDRCAYFPSYEIVLDELRDYRFYAEDMVHPSAQAINYIFERLIDAALPPAERPLLEAHLKAFRHSRHDPDRKQR